MISAAPRPPPADDRDKAEILQAISTLAQSGVRISVEQIRGREDLLAQFVELTTEFRAATDHLVRLNGSVARHESEVAALKLRAAARDAACPLIEALRVEIRAMQAAILKDLQDATDVAIKRNAELAVEQRWGEPHHALCPACGDCPDIGTSDADHYPWAGHSEGLGGEGTVATTRAWISTKSVFMPVDVPERRLDPLFPKRHSSSTMPVSEWATLRAGALLSQPMSAKMAPRLRTWLHQTFTTLWAA
jgi:hypothetical protein